MAAEVQVRGSAFLNTSRSVRERHGAAAHEQVLAALPGEAAALFRAPVRDAAWLPLRHLVAYMEEAQRRLAPGDPAFFRGLGRDAGRLTRETGVRHLIGDDPLGTARRAAFLWGSFYDTGRAEIVARRPGEIVFRIHGFRPPSRAWCERIVGWMQGCFDTLGLPEADIRETSCVLEAAPHCEIQMCWRAPTLDTPEGAP